MSDILFHVQDLRVEFQHPKEKKPLLALAIDTLDIYRQDFVCVVGPSGCGKSTLLNILAGFRPASHGQVLFENRPIQAPELARGVVFQKNSLLPWLNVWQNIGFPLKIQGIDKHEMYQRSLDWLKIFNLSEFAEHSLTQLSGGMLQLVAIARALITQPKALLLDEPLGALDALTRESTQSILLDFYARTQTTFFLVTHSIEEALLLGNRLVVISARPGRIIEVFSPPFQAQCLAGSTAQSVKSSPQFQEWRSQILNSLSSKV